MSRTEKAPNSELTALYEKRGKYVEGVRRFLREAPLGSPRFLAVDDLAESFFVKVPYMFDTIKDPALREMAQLLNRTQRDDAHVARVRERELLIPGYLKATEELSNIIPGEVLEYMIEAVETGIAKETDPTYPGAGYDSACNQLRLVINERLYELEGISE